MCIFDDRPSGLNFETFNNRVVKASLYDTGDDAIRAINSICYKANLKVIDTGVFFFFFLSIPDTFIGKAKLNVAQGDTWNEETGSQLARERCLSKYHKAFDSRIAIALEDARTLVACFEHYCNKHSIDTSKVMSIEDIKDRKFSGTGK